MEITRLITAAIAITGLVVKSSCIPVFRLLYKQAYDMYCRSFAAFFRPLVFTIMLYAHALGIRLPSALCEYGV
jgi:hypothetical protein